MSAEEDAQWLSETFDWDRAQALGFVRQVESRVLAAAHCDCCRGRCACAGKAIEVLG